MKVGAEAGLMSNFCHVEVGVGEEGFCVTKSKAEKVLLGRDTKYRTVNGMKIRGTEIGFDGHFFYRPILGKRSVQPFAKVAESFVGLGGKGYVFLRYAETGESGDQLLAKQGA